jgi:hypothetical protein
MTDAEIGKRKPDLRQESREDKRARGRTIPAERSGVIAESSATLYRQGTVEFVSTAALRIPSRSTPGHLLGEALREFHFHGSRPLACSTAVTLAEEPFYLFWFDKQKHLL